MISYSCFLNELLSCYLSRIGNFCKVCYNMTKGFCQHKNSSSSSGSVKQRAVACWVDNGKARIPVVPDKPLTEVSKLGRYYYSRGELLRGMDGTPNCYWWFEFCSSGLLQWLQWSHHPKQLDVVWCTAVDIGSKRRGVVVVVLCT